MVRRTLSRLALSTVVVLAAELAYALLRPAPRLEGFDPSGEFGDPSLPTLRVVALGDSSVTAPGVNGPDDIWITRICRRLALDRHVELVSLAIGGSRAQDLIRDQLDAALAYRPDLVFVSVGANDAIKRVPIGRFTDDLDYIVESLVDIGATVVLSGVGVMGTIPRLYPPLSSWMNARSARFDRAHHEVATRHGTAVVDQRSDDVALWNRDRSLWAADYFHVSAAGHARWAETAWRAVEPVVNDRVESN